ncbi:MAG TPA: hypothetical protein VHM24_09745 [Gemmatimonadaceae bacterium]|nr:hypothetical protein [Gemmatimonadaceae bacterium]
MKKVLRAFLVLSILSAWSATSAQTQRLRSGPVRVFIDCNTSGCDFDYFRTEIPYVDYVRDRTDASLHVLVTTQSTGSGGIEYTFNFIGLRDFAGVSDTLRYVSQQSATEDDRRKGIAQTLKMGLVRYIARTSSADRLQIGFVKPSAVDSAKAGDKATRDPWNFWVFRLRANGNFNGESSQRFSNLHTSVSANRVTKDWKINNSANVNYSESKFTFNEGEEFKSYSRSYGISELIVKSLGEHWSAGQRASMTSSTFLNTKQSLSFAPAIEYNLFPYSQSTRKQLTLQYSAGVTSYRYRDTTIFDKISEVRPHQSLTASVSTTQPWGSIAGSVEGATYLDDLTKRRLVIFNSINARLFKGFSFNMFGSLSLLRDQLYLSKGGATDEEILLQRRQLSTSYSYFVGVGFSYTFGSIFNNVVNPRFEGAGGQFFFF